MEDVKIIELFNQRDENAIAECTEKYGNLLKKISFNILGNKEDSEECFNDTLNKLWSTIPPKNPNSLVAYMGKIVRNLSINKYRENHAQKRYSGGDLLLSELSECIPDKSSVETVIDTNDLTEYINKWLRGLETEKCNIFIRRYWYGDSIKDIAMNYSATEKKIAGILYRLRESLKKYLEKEGVNI
ncbi:MAG: RNA polymerase sigma factor [Acutalibacteraceae bacterium]